MTEKEAKDLITRFTEGNCTPDEAARLKSWYNNTARTARVDTTMEELIEKKQQTRNSFPAPIQRRIYPIYIKYAAAVVAVLGISSIFYINTLNHKKHLTSNHTITNSIMPGGNNAILTLANGTKINLKDVRSGSVTTASGALITIDTSNGIVIYKSSKTSMDNNHAARTEKIYNTISTPNGGQYQLILPDGTRVFLNASSSLQFPTRFAAHLRSVNLVGEAYFEVAKNTKQPFQVTTKGQLLTVLGTHFNISAYPNEAIKTTLSQGSVQLQNTSSLKKRLLKPEQQSILTRTGFDLKNVNSENEMAWKRGLFFFRQTPLKEALQQISRWYNVEVDYSNLPDVPLDAELTRDLTLNKIIEILDVNAELKFKLTNNGRRLVYIGK
ncbi:FecR family protein [Pedobacter sp.]|jgi:transmembrane sensor|uniref:FecR family protein n=1 Tax=Pedobacter sp. TaxID=1411316 RepID=UPI002BCB27EA|nr:FecR domain-containing protein [Pedobacter sp.]HWW41304.1 FecR domain-containing protein [Pedobacter sp.]